jgi:hypothetical protein
MRSSNTILNPLYQAGWNAVVETVNNWNRTGQDTPSLVTSYLQNVTAQDAYAEGEKDACGTYLTHRYLPEWGDS